MTGGGGAPVMLDLRDGVARVRLAHPERCNALTAELLEALNDALDKAADAAPRAVVLAAEGRHFSTGGDVARFAAEVAAGRGASYADDVVGGLNTAILRLLALPCPVLAQVQGAVTGGALGLALAADLVVMTPDAFVQPWYARVGFAPDGGWTALLPARIGPARARAVQLLNDRIDAPEALALGLCHAVAADPAACIAGWLDRLADHDPGAMAALKWLTGDHSATAAALEAERLAFVALIDSPATADGMARFLSRRKERA